MAYRPILYTALAATLAISTAGSRAIPTLNYADSQLLRQCVEGSLPLEQRVGNTAYVRVNAGDSGKVLYFIPNTHWQGDLQRDGRAIQSLVETNLIDALVLEGLDYTGRSVPIENIKTTANFLNPSSSLAQAIRRNDIKLFGSENSELRDWAISVERASFLNDFLRIYPEYLSGIIKIEQRGLIRNHSSSDFKKRFSQTINDYHKELQQFKKEHPYQDLSEKAANDLLVRQRELAALGSITKVSNSFGRIAILGGGAHISKFIDALCNSSHTILVAQQDDDISAAKTLELTKGGEIKIPQKIETVYQTYLQMRDYYSEARTEAGLK